ncbi:MAG: hypothetical protein CBB60_006825 [Armatimonadetes bacterium Cent15-Ar3]|nr:MAG: hypothetical protein CBB60_006825 [Armatimonadetes bacterium Cent15-Ar3]
MVKSTHLGSAGPDDPIYKEGVTMYAKPSFPRRENSPESKAGTPSSQQPPSQTQAKEPLRDDEIPMDEFLTEEHWEGVYGPEVAKRW